MVLAEMGALQRRLALVNSLLAASLSGLINKGSQQKQRNIGGESPYPVGPSGKNLP